jgi:hypothetical protein
MNKRVDLNALPARLRQKIRLEPNSGCWIWTGACTGGYGEIKFLGMKFAAHRFVHELFFNTRMGRKSHLHHRCETPRCVNPHHLEAKAAKDHLQLHLEKHGQPNGNSVKTHCKHGHEFNAQNTYLRSDGGRTCRICVRDRMRGYRLKSRADG